MVRNRLLAELGRRIRELRELSGLSLSDLARRSHLSRRYLTETEAGRANLSILKLAAIAGVLQVRLSWLCDLALPAPLHRRYALVGLRGAGKSTIGRQLALELEVPFVELDRLIEERSGLHLDEIFSLHGQSYYRKLEREALESWLERAGAAVLATGGSIVTHAETYERLLNTCHTVWLKAEPEDHWNRVINQGDLRPMRRHPRAMEELREILAERDDLYRRAHLMIDTSGVDIPRVVDAVLERDLEPH